MKYERPQMEIVPLQQGNIFTLSVEGSGSGTDVDGEEGGWS